MQHPYTNDIPLYSQPPLFPYPPQFIPSQFRPKVKPTISFCPAFSKGLCKLGESCPLNHINVSNIVCKHNLKNKCKFGDSCLFKHHPEPNQIYSELSPVVQHIVQENLSLLSRLEAAEERIQALESAVSALQTPSLPESHNRPAAPTQSPFAKRPGKEHIIPPTPTLCPGSTPLQQKQQHTQKPTPVKSPLSDIPILQHKHTIRCAPIFKPQPKSRPIKKLTPSEPPKPLRAKIICGTEKTVTPPAHSPPPSMSFNSYKYQIGQKFKPKYINSPVILQVHSRHIQAIQNLLPQGLDTMNHYRLSNGSTYCETSSEFGIEMCYSLHPPVNESQYQNTDKQCIKTDLSHCSQSLR